MIDSPCHTDSEAGVVERLVGVLGVVLALVILMAVFALPWLSWYVSYDWQLLQGEASILEQCETSPPHCRQPTLATSAEPRRAGQ